MRMLLKISVAHICTSWKTFNLFRYPCLGIVSIERKWIYSEIKTSDISYRARMALRFDRSRIISRVSRPVRDRERREGKRERRKDVSQNRRRIMQLVRDERIIEASRVSVLIYCVRCPPCSWHAVLPFTRQGRYRKAGKDARKPVRTGRA